MDPYEYEAVEQPYLHTRLLNTPIIGFLYALLWLVIFGIAGVAVFAIFVAILSLGGCIPFGC